MVFSVLLLAEEEVEILESEGAGEVFLSENVVSEGAFLFLEEADFFLDGVFDEEAVGEDGLFLADAVGAVDGLGFDGGVPPGVEEDDIGGGGEIEAGAAGFEADEEGGGAVVGLEFLDELAAVFGGAVEAEGFPFAGGEGLADEGEHFEELGGRGSPRGRGVRTWGGGWRGSGRSRRGGRRWLGGSWIR